MTQTEFNTALEDIERKAATLKNIRASLKECDNVTHSLAPQIKHFGEKTIEWGAANLVGKIKLTHTETKMIHETAPIAQKCGIASVQYSFFRAFGKGKDQTLTLTPNPLLSSVCDGITKTIELDTDDNKLADFLAYLRKAGETSENCRYALSLFLPKLSDAMLEILEPLNSAMEKCNNVLTACAGCSESIKATIAAVGSLKADSDSDDDI